MFLTDLEIWCIKTKTSGGSSCHAELTKRLWEVILRILFNRLAYTTLNIAEIVGFLSF